MPGEIVPASFDWIEVIQRGGAISAVLEFGALLWLADRLKKADATIALKDAKLESISERTITLMIELKGLISGRSAHK